MGPLAFISEPWVHRGHMLYFYNPLLVFIMSCSLCQKWYPRAFSILSAFSNSAFSNLAFSNSAFSILFLQDPFFDFQLS